VRDLAWACFSAPLIDCAELDDRPTLYNCDFPLTAARRQWLEELDRAPAPLEEWLDDAGSGRLGLYFEKLWQYFLQQDGEVELLAHNLPVRDGTRTVGEFDAIYYCRRRQRHVHLELAVKFYLKRGGASPDWRSWLGPNSQDRLDRKLQRLRQHQMRLAASPAGHTALKALGVDAVLHEMEVKGRLYQHPGEPRLPPPAASAELALQRWLYLGEIDRALSGEGDYRLLQRRQWLAPVRRDDTPQPAAGKLRAQLEDSLVRSARPQQIARFDGALEVERLFIVPDDWPRTRAG